MKLSAVRLSEVGHFRNGVALEGLSGGLDVIAGPNEMGKSTIFRAIETVFRHASTSDNEATRSLAPLQGGAPLIEVEFELEGTHWRLRKRYLSQKVAELVDLDRKDLLRGADAENRLADLVAGRFSRKQMLDLVWVGQRHSLELPKDNKNGDISKSLGRLIEDEIADAAGDGLARRMREAATKALDELVTPANRQRAKVGKPYKIAIDDRDRAKAAFDKALADAQAAAHRLADLQKAQTALADVAQPAKAAERAASFAALRKALDDATRAAEALQRAALVVETRQAARQQADDRLREIVDSQRAVGQLRADLATTAAALAGAVGDVERLTAEQQAMQGRHVDTTQRSAELQAGLEVHHRWERHRTAMTKVDELVRRAESARAASLRMAELDRLIAAEPVDERGVTEMRRAQSMVDKLDAQLGAALPRVRIDYAPGGAGRIQVAGVSVIHSGEIAPASTITLEIEGVGRITVAAPSGAAEELAERTAAARAAFAVQLSSAHVKSIEDAETRLELRQQLTAERQAVAARLAAQAPDGLAVLEAALATARADVDQSLDLPPEPIATRSQFSGELAALRLALVEIERGLSVTQAALLEASRRQSRLATEHDGLAARLSQREATLPVASEIAAEQALRQDALANAEAELNIAVLERNAWSAGVLAPAVFIGLEAQFAAATRAKEQNKQLQQQLALSINGLESALARDRQDGVEGVLEDARATLDTAEARVGRYKREVDELELLERLLMAEASAARGAELKPVVDRLQDYARFVFPQAQFELGDMLAVRGLVREGTNLSHGRLSGGTSEQIAILVRLAYARLLADRGEALPMVLDDSLVYADAVRFGAMFTALEVAARHHQVIMLTCHAERIAALGVRPEIKTVPIVAWKPDETAVVG